jgi:signal transduction histidine kinase
MTPWQRHPAWRRAFITSEQLACAAVIFALAGWAWRVLGDRQARPGVVTVLVATAVVAAVLAVSRRWFERVANWIAFGEHADGYELASRFLTRMATTLEADEVLPRLAETAARSIGSRRGEVRVWLADGNTWRQTWPQDAAQGDLDVIVPVQHGGDPVGQMAVSVDAAELSPADRRLLDQLAGPAGLALSTVRLTHALRQQAAEIEAATEQIRASRQRIVEARRIEQDRIRRRLTASVQPHLDAACQHLGDRDPAVTLPPAALLRAAAGEVSQALEELRNLARGLFPARLAETGLLPCLRSWAEQRGRILSLEGPSGPDELRLTPDVAATLYFCAVTVLTGAEGAAGVSLDIGAGTSGDEVTMEVRAGRFDVTTFEGLKDRADAFDGRVAVAPPPGALVRISLPLLSIPSR